MDTIHTTLCYVKFQHYSLTSALLEGTGVDMVVGGVVGEGRGEVVGVGEGGGHRL